MQRIKRAIKRRIKAIGKFIVFKWILPLVYKWYARKPVDEKLVVFADFRDRPMPDNFVSIYDMCKKGDFHCEVLSGRPYGKAVPKWKRRKEKIRFQFLFIKLYAQCKVLFLVEDFPLADTVKTRPETQVVQLWHGCGIMKKWGYAVTSNGWGASERERKRYPPYLNQTLSCISSASKMVRDGYQSAFNCSAEIIKPLGCPRTDVYFDKEFRAAAKHKVDSVFPEIGSRKIILYAPTFRGKSIPASYTNINLDFGEMRERLGEKYAVIVKLHPQSVKGGLTEPDQIKGHGFVFDATQLMSPEELLCVADVLVTDYSSILFEYMLFERPIVSYIYDIDEYVEDRGLFFPYDQLAPGPYVYTQEKLIEKLETVEDWFDIEKTRRYKEEFMSACDGHSTERIYQFVFGKTPSDDKKSDGADERSGG